MVRIARDEDIKTQSGFFVNLCEINVKMPDHKTYNDVLLCENKETFNCLSLFSVFSNVHQTSRSSLLKTERERRRRTNIKGSKQTDTETLMDGREPVSNRT